MLPIGKIFTGKTDAPRTNIHSCSRPDLSKTLIHLTKGGDDEEAFESLKNIIRQKTLLQSQYLFGGKRGEHCVCFTETPVGCLQSAGGFKNYTDYTKYSCFGIMVSREDIYDRGGRPVLYLEEKYLDELPLDLKWRFQKFEPTFTSPRYDWTWEREWRIPGSFIFDGLYFEAIVPSIDFANRLREDFDREQIEIYEDCQNSKVPNLNLSDLCIPDFDQGLCPEPKEFDKSIICIDGTC